MDHERIGCIDCDSRIPAGAALFVDGEQRGTTPFDLTLAKKKPPKTDPFKRFD